MAGESQQPPDSVPDPSTLTMDAIARGDRVEREYMLAQIAALVARLDAMDEATRVLNETVTRTPTDIQQAVGALKELTDVKFDAVQRQFADSKTAIDAALSAQEKLGVQQNEANQTAINKSETTTNESIRAVAEKIDDVRSRVGTLESTKQGGREERQERREMTSGQIALISVAVAVVGVALAVTVAIGLN